MGPSTALVIDCDPGIDDAVALALAVGSPEVELRQVTTVSGNSPVDVTTRNALQLLDAFGRQDVPVAAGASRALVRVGWHGLPSPHSENGLGRVRLDRETRLAEPVHAVDRLADLLRRAAPRSVVVAAIGPLTNLALLLALHPECAGGIDRLVVMGGSTGPGNITASAEFNLWTDPEAAQRVLTDSGLDVTLVGLDVTRRATVDPAMLEALRAASERGRLLADMIVGYRDRRAGAWAMHDVLALAAVVDPTLVSTRPAEVEVDTGSGPERGRTRCTFLDEDAGSPPPSPAGFVRTTTRCRVAVDLDVARFRELLLERVTG